MKIGKGGRRTACIAALALLFACAGVAEAQTPSPTDAQYDPASQVVTDPGSDAAPNPPAGGPEGSATQGTGFLPFTGLELGIMAMVCGLLLALGFALRRLAHPTPRRG